MGVCLTSTCISLAISWLTRSIWRSLQGSPLLPSPSLTQPSMAQFDSVATVCPHPQTQSGPGVDPIRAPAIMSSLIWTCHTSPDTYPRHAVTFCPAGAKKHSGGFLPLLCSPTLAVVLFSLSFSFFLVLSRSFPLLTLSVLASITLSLLSTNLQLHAKSPAFTLCPLQFRLMCSRLCMWRI